MGQNKSRWSERFAGVDLSFSILGIGGGLHLDLDKPDARELLYTDLDKLDKLLKKDNAVKSVDDAKRHCYFTATLPMHVVPFTNVNPPVVWYSGETKRNYVAAGGQLDDEQNKPPGYAKAVEGAELLGSEREVAYVIATSKNLGRKRSFDFPRGPDPKRRDWAGWVADAHRRFQMYKQFFPMTEVDLLAWTEDARAASDATFGKGVVVGRPLYVRYP